MKMMFIGADHEVTGSCHYVEACGKRFIVDYGMEQGLKFMRMQNFLSAQEVLILYC